MQVLKKSPSGREYFQQMRLSEFDKLHIGADIMLMQNNFVWFGGETWTRKYQMAGSIAFGKLEKSGHNYYAQLNDGSRLMLPWHGKLFVVDCRYGAIRERVCDLPCEQIESPKHIFEISDGVFLRRASLLE